MAAFNDFTRVGVECNNASGVFNSTEWPGSRSANHYVEFDGNAPIDAAFAFTGGTAISFTARRSGTGPTEGELMYQAEGSDFESLGTWTLEETDEQEMSFRLAEIDQSWNVRFRFYAWGATSDRGTLRFDDVQVSFGIVGTDVDNESELPAAFALLPAYPNPFNPVTTIQIDVNTSQRLRIEVIDALGRQVAVITDQHFPAGRRAILFDAAHLTSGLYLIRAIGAEGVSMQRAILMK